MKIFRKVTSLTLVLCMCFSLIGNAYAVEANTDVERDMRVEDVKVDGILDFSEEALEAVENYVHADENCFFYVADENALRSVLTDDEYCLVLEQIEITNAEAMVGAVSDGTGTESSPYVLRENSAYGTSAKGASSTWFIISGIRGATDFIINTSVSATATIYKKSLFGKTQIATASGKNINKVISASDTNNNSNNYIINVQVGAAMTSSITVRQHTDSTTLYYSGGTIWKPNSLSAMPNTNLLTMNMWYLKVDDVDKLSTFVNNDNYIQYVDAFMSGTMTAASIAVAIWGLAGGGDAATLVGIAMTLISFSSADMFRKSILDNLNSAGGWNGQNFTKPVYMKQVFDVNSALTFYYIYTWTGNTLYGEAGYTGSFSSKA